jgi:hypothetical protein
LDLVTQRHDLYALPALVSELERSGDIFKLFDALVDPVRRSVAEEALLVALRAGTRRLLARSGETQLIPQLERLAAAAKPWREQRVTRWLLQQLRAEQPRGPQPQKVPA